MPESQNALSTPGAPSTAQVRAGRPFSLTEAWEPLIRVTALDRLLTLGLSSVPFPASIGQALGKAVAAGQERPGVAPTRQS